jgi:hypothetical protein
MRSLLLWDFMKTNINDIISASQSSLFPALLMPLHAEPLRP